MKSLNKYQLDLLSLAEIYDYRRTFLRSDFKDWKRHTEELEVYIKERFPEDSFKIWDKGLTSKDPLEQQVVKIIKMFDKDDWENAKEQHRRTFINADKEKLGESKYGYYDMTMWETEKDFKSVFTN